MHAGRAHAHKLRLLHLANAAGPAIAHARAQAADVLHHHFRQRSFVGHPAFDAFGHELFEVVFDVLEIAVFRTQGHRAEGAHAAVDLKLSTVVDDRLAGSLFYAGEQSAGHDHVGAGHDGLGDVAGVAHAAVADDRHARSADRLGGFVDRRELRHADAGHDPGGANTAGADAHFYGIGAGIDQRFSSFARGDVAGNDLQVGIRVLHLPHGLQHAHRMPVRRIDHDRIDAHIDQGIDPLEHIARYADGGAYDQAAQIVLAGDRVVLHFHDVFVGDEPHQYALRIDDRQLFDLVALQDLFGLLQSSADRGRDQILRGHQLAHRAVDRQFEAQVAVRENADQSIVLADDRNTTDAKFAHQLQRIRHPGLRQEGDRIDDHAALRTLDHPHLLGLRLDGHILVNNAHPSLPGNGNGQLDLGDRVHRGRNDRHVQANIAGKLRGNIDVAR